MKQVIAAITLGLAAIVNNASAQTVWNDGGGDQLWSTSANWSAGVPTTTSAVQIGTQPTGDQIGIDTGAATTVASFTFNNTLTASVDITSFTYETLQVNGAITNNSGFTDSFSLPVYAGANETWSGPLKFTNTVTVSTYQLTLNNAVSFSGSDLYFDITNSTTYGQFVGSGTATVTGVTINIGGTYRGVQNQTFDFTTGNFFGATLGTLPTLDSGLAWDTSNFLSSGILTVIAIPEPTSLALLATGGLLVTGTVLRRRRKVA
jgi:hypothetical protein